jgi:hypothetical protein
MRRQIKTFPADQNSPHRYRAIGNIKYGPYPEVNEIDHVSVNDTVNQISYSTAQYQRKTDNVSGAEDLIVLPVIINIKKQQDNRDDRHQRGNNVGIPEKSKGDTGIMDHREMEYIFEYRDGLAVIEDRGKKYLRKPVNGNDTCRYQ